MNVQKRQLEAFEKNKTKRPAGEETWFSRLKKSSVGLSVTALVVLITGVAGMTDALDKIAIWAHIKPDSFQLAQAGEKEKFSRDLTRAIWFRLYMTRKVLIAQTKTNVTDAEKEKTWDRYQTLLDDWNRDLMVNILSLSQFYGRIKSVQFEHLVQPRFAAINSCLELIRRPVGETFCMARYNQDLKGFERYIDDLNAKLYCYVAGLPNGDKNECFEDEVSREFQKRRG